MVYLYAFLFGGALCAFAQILLEFFKLTPAHVTTIFVILGGFLEMLGVYKVLVDVFSSGALIPITNFGSLVTKSAYEGLMDGGFLGMLKEIMVSTSAGIAFATFLAVIFALLFKSRS